VRCHRTGPRPLLWLPLRVGFPRATALSKASPVAFPGSTSVEAASQKASSVTQAPGITFPKEVGTPERTGTPDPELDEAQAHLFSEFPATRTKDRTKDLHNHVARRLRIGYPGPRQPCVDVCVLICASTGTAVNGQRRPQGIFGIPSREYPERARQGQG
jgi:hypothetical protein